MTDKNEENSKLDEGAAKLHEGAAKLAEGAGKLHEGASALHEVAAHLAGEGDCSRHTAGHSSGALDSSNAAVATSQITRVRTAQLRNAISGSGARAFVLVRRHPLASLTTLGLAAAFIKVELALGLIAGVTGAAFLVNQRGPEVRQTLVANGRLALARAREAWQTRRRSLPEPAVLN